MEVEIIKGDITKINTKAIVNAANTSLLGGGGVDGAIHKAGGKQILEECIRIRNKQGGCKVGEAVITNAGKLNAEKIIHTVGPVWNGGNSNEDELLRSCYQTSLKLAELHNLDTIAFPNISTGIYKFPKARAANIAISVIKNYEYDCISKVTFVCFDDENYNLYKSII